MLLGAELRRKTSEILQEPHVCFLVPRHEQHRVNFAKGLLIVGEAECLTEEILRPQSPVSFRHWMLQETLSLPLLSLRASRRSFGACGATSRVAWPTAGRLGSGVRDLAERETPHERRDGWFAARTRASSKQSGGLERCLLASRGGLSRGCERARRCPSQGPLAESQCYTRRR